SQRTKAGSDLGSLEGELRVMAVDRETLTRVSAELEALSGLKGPGVGPKIRGLDVDLRRLDVELTKIENEVEALKDEIKGYDTAELARKRALCNERLKEEGRLQQDIADRQLKIEE